MPFLPLRTQRKTAAAAVKPRTRTVQSSTNAVECDNATCLGLALAQVNALYPHHSLVKKIKNKKLFSSN